MLALRPSLVALSLTLLALLCVSTTARAQKVYLNPSDQTGNPVANGGNEAEYALIDANLTADILNSAGFTAKVDQDFDNAPSNANSWGADIFVSIHTNAGGGHGTETLYKSDGGKNLATHIQNGLLSTLPYSDRGLVFRDNLHVLNATDMYACLLEAVFHDCSSESGSKGHPPSESAFLKSSEGQQKIAAGIAAGVCSYYGKSCTTTPPQKGWLKGVVYKDPDLNDHLANAVVTVQGGPTATYDGTTPWAFELDPGDYTVTATLDGYEPNSVVRAVVAGQEVWGSIGLKPAQPVVDASVPETAVEAALPDTGSKPDSTTTKDATAEATTSDAGRPRPSAEPTTNADPGCTCGLAAGGSSRFSFALLVLASIALARRRSRSHLL